MAEAMVTLRPIRRGGAVAEEGRGRRTRSPAVLHFRIGRLLLVHSKPDAALAHFERAQRARSRQRRGRVRDRDRRWSTRSRFKDAIPHLRDGAERRRAAQPGGLRSRARAGRAPAIAPGRCRRCRAIRPDNPADAGSWNALGQLALQLQSPSLAAAFFNEAIARGAARVEAAPGHGARARDDGAATRRRSRSSSRASRSIPRDPAAQLNLAVALAEDRAEGRRAHARGGGAAPQARTTSARGSSSGRSEVIRRIRGRSRRCCCSRLVLAAAARRRAAAADARRGAAVDPARHARHDARRRDRARGGRRRDAGVQRDCRARTALPPGLRHRARDAAVARLDDDRPLSRRPRRPRERALRAGERAARRRAAAAGRLPHVGVRLVVRARAALRPRARVRRLRRRRCRRGRTSATRARRPTPRSRELRPRRRSKPRFLWVHYYDPHAPYAPPEPYRSAVREAIRISAKWRRWTSSSAGWSRRSSARRAGPAAIVDRRAITARGSAITARRSTAICSTSRRCTCRWCWRARRRRRRQRHAGQHAPRSFTRSSTGPASTRRTACDRRTTDEVVLGEAMKPFLEYGWQPQVMAVAGRYKAILAGTIETYDLARGSRRDARSRHRRRRCRPACARRSRTIRCRRPTSARAPANLDEDAKRRLASARLRRRRARRRSCARTRRVRPT